MVDGAPQGNRQVGFNAGTSRLEVVVVLCLILEVEVVLRALH